MTDAPVVQLNLSAELSNAHRDLNSTLHRLAAFAAVGERLGKLPRDLDLPAPDILIRFGHQGSEGEYQEEPPEVRDNFAEYCARFSVVGMVTACEEFLHRVLFTASIGAASHEHNGRLTGPEFNEMREGIRKEVRRSSVDGLALAALRRLNLEESVVPQISYFRSVHGIRKCLLHRGGIVREDDVDEEGFLRAVWCRPVFLLGDEEIKSFPLLGKDGDTISFRFDETARSWRLGDHVKLTARDCQDIAWTLSAFAQQTIQACSQALVALAGGKANGEP